MLFLGECLFFILKFLDIKQWVQVIYVLSHSKMYNWKHQLNEGHLVLEMHIYVGDG